MCRAWSRPNHPLVLGDGRQWAYESWALKATSATPGRGVLDGTPFTLVVRALGCLQRLQRRSQLRGLAPAAARAGRTASRSACPSSQRLSPPALQNWGRADARCAAYLTPDASSCASHAVEMGGQGSAFTAQTVPGTSTHFFLVSQVRRGQGLGGGPRCIHASNPDSRPCIYRAGLQDRADRLCPKRFLGAACLWGSPHRALMEDAATEHGGYRSGVVALFEQDTLWASTKWQLLRWAGGWLRWAGPCTRRAGRAGSTWLLGKLTTQLPPSTRAHCSVCTPKGAPCSAAGRYGCCAAQALACARLAAGRASVCASKSSAPGLALSKGASGANAFIKVQLTAPADSGTGAGKPGPGELAVPARLLASVQPGGLRASVP